MKKTVLLIGGAGTIGSAVAKEALKMGCKVDIICLEDCVSDNEDLRYFKAKATLDYLRGFLADKYYDAILDLLHHNVPEDYIAFHMEIAPKTGHEIFFSSIRAVSGATSPLSEETPTLLDLLDSGELVDPEFAEKDTYSLSKARCERYLRTVSKYRNFTIIRPMINTSDKRFDIVQYTFYEPINYAREGKIMYLPELCRHNVAGLEWAGNTGKMIANLLFKPECFGKTYMLSTGHRMTWEDVANIYTDLLGLQVKWVALDEYVKQGGRYGFPVIYDRGYDRATDNRAILAATGLTAEDFTPFRDGVIAELRKVGALD